MTTEKPVSIKKDESLAIWRALPENKPLFPEPIPYKHRGTTIDEDGLRICGSREFIESVLSRLKPLLRFEAPETRLGISWSEIQDRETGAVIRGKYRCSVQVHERGEEAKMCNLFCEGAKRRTEARQREIQNCGSLNLV